MNGVSPVTECAGSWREPRGLSCMNVIIFAFAVVAGLSCKSIHTKINIQITDNSFHRMDRGKHRVKDPVEPQKLHKVAKQPGMDVRLTCQSN